MIAFTLLERTAIEAVLAEMDTSRSAVERQLRHAVVRSRENTGGGFFTEIEVNPAAESLDRRAAPLGHIGQNVWISIEGLQYGLGMILHLEDGRASLLEGYAVGPEDTSSIDFEQVRFAAAKEPGPFPLHGS